MNDIVETNKNLPLKTIEPAQAITPMELLQQAMVKGVDIDQMTKLMDLHERWEKNEARKAYVASMNEFKANPPELYKDMTVAYKEVRYSHASLEMVAGLIGKVLSTYNLSHKWTTDQGEFGVKVTCVITHSMGHSEKTTLQAPADNSGSKNNIQAIGSTITYLQRYTLLALTGIAVKGQDDDGLATSIITEEEFEEINGLLDDAEAVKKKFCERFKITDVRNLLGVDYRKAKVLIKNQISAKRKQGNANESS